MSKYSAKAVSHGERHLIVTAMMKKFSTLYESFTSVLLQHKGFWALILHISAQVVKIRKV